MTSSQGCSDGGKIFDETCSPSITITIIRILIIVFAKCEQNMKINGRVLCHLRPPVLTNLHICFVFIITILLTVSLANK